MHWLPKARAPSAIRLGLRTAPESIETFSAPASSTARMSSSVRKPPPTLNGMKISRATARTTSIMIPRRSLEAVMS